VFVWLVFFFRLLLLQCVYLLLAYPAHFISFHYCLLITIFVCLGIKHPSGAQTVAGLLKWSALSDERTGLSFSIAAGPYQRIHFRVRFPWDS
jgi:hypothetical protein